MADLRIHLARTTPRLRYVLDVLCGEWLGLRWRATATDPHLSYGAVPPAPLHCGASAWWEYPTPWQEPPLTTFRGYAAPFSVAGGTWPFDLIAAVGWLLTRAEEYAPFVPDRHGRFPAARSWAARHDCLTVPLVDYWVSALAEALRTRYPRLPLRLGAYAFQPTFDIDNAYAFRGKGVSRWLAATGRELLQRKGNYLRRRAQTLYYPAADPFDVYDALNALHDCYAVAPRYFWLVGQYGPYDKNLSLRSPLLRALVARTARRYPVGLHPSYGSWQRPERVARERAALEAAAGEPVTHSRQHFLRFRLPGTYRDLLAAGIRVDYSLGYADAVGYRAGTGRTFPWYDLRAERATPLRLVPFALMDTALRQTGHTPPLALATVQATVGHARRTAAPLTAVFHNESPGGFGPWAGWEDFYAQTLAAAF